VLQEYQYKQNVYLVYVKEVCSVLWGNDIFLKEFENFSTLVMNLNLKGEKFSFLNLSS
jgi:hypothetical protein